MLLGGFIYPKQITKPRNVGWRCSRNCFAVSSTLDTTLDLDDPKLVTSDNPQDQIPFEI